MLGILYLYNNFCRWPCQAIHTNLWEIECCTVILILSSNKIIRALKECSNQYSVFMEIHIVTGNENLFKIYFKKTIFQDVFVFIDLFYRYHYPLYFVYSDCKWHHVCTTCNSRFFSIKSFTCRPWFLLEIWI